MKHFLQRRIAALKGSILRFPFSLLYGLALTLYLLYLVLQKELWDTIGDSPDRMRIILLLIYGVHLSHSFSLLAEGAKESKAKLLHILTPVLLGAYYLRLIWYPNAEENMPAIEIFAIYLFLKLSTYLCGKLREGRHYAAYVLECFMAQFKSFFMSGVLCAGILFIYISFCLLFSVGIEEKLILSIVIVVFCFFELLVRLSYYPQPQMEKKEGNAFFKILFLYIITPVLLAYTLVLVLYYLRCLYLRNFPVVLLGHLILWYGLLAVFLLFFVSAWQESNGFAKIVKRLLPLLLLPSVVMLFVTIGARILSYGITLNRYYVAAGGIFVLLCMIWYLCRPKAENRSILLLAMCFSLLTGTGPLSGRELQFYSLHNRLLRILRANDMLNEQGKVQPGKDISEADQESISSILYILADYPERELAFLPEDENYDFAEHFGFENYGYAYSADSDSEGKSEYYSFYSSARNKALPLAGYEKLHEISVSYYGEEEREEEKLSEDLHIRKSAKGIELIFMKDGAEWTRFLLSEEELLQKVKLLEQLKESKKGELIPEDSYLEGENEKMKYRLYIFSLSIERIENKIENAYLSAILLYSYQ